MTKQRAQQIIVVSLVVMLASTVGGSLAEKKAKGTEAEKEKYYGRKIVGGFLAMLFLSLLAEAAPAPAAYMSIASSGYAFFHYGLPAIEQQSPKQGKANTNNATEMAVTTGLETIAA
jgi:hypothetical protein